MMVEPLDQESKLERRALRRANELFLQRLQAERDKRIQQRVHRGEEYNGNDDFAKSYKECLAEIRERIAAGGPGWKPP